MKNAKRLVRYREKALRDFKTRTFNQKKRHLKIRGYELSAEIIFAEFSLGVIPFVNRTRSVNIIGQIK